MSNGENKLKTASEQLADLKAMIDDFLNASHARFNKKFDEEWQTAANADVQTLKSLTKDELFDWSYILYSYSTHLQDELNMQKIALEWCNDKLDKMVAKNYDQFSPYTKHEMRRQLIVMNDEFAATVDHYREIAESRVKSLDGKIYELKRKADILMEKGKRS
tara:strand:+ start:2162 stop:2647 length:486 start_codon:yes stop_codon:yes gene_type:complete